MPNPDKDEELIEVVKAAIGEIETGGNPMAIGFPEPVRRILSSALLTRVAKAAIEAARPLIVKEAEQALLEEMLAFNELLPTADDGAPVPSQNPLDVAIRTSIKKTVRRFAKETRGIDL